jgi:hypothetical protein
MPHEQNNRAVSMNEKARCFIKCKLLIAKERDAIDISVEWF